MYEVCVTREFCSAHFLRDYQGKCANIHGHNWKIELAFQAEKLNDDGLLVDFFDIGSALDKVIEIIDHKNINDIPPFDQINPTSENLSRWFFDQIKQVMPDAASSLYRVKIWETPDAYASYMEDLV